MSPRFTLAVLAVCCSACANASPVVEMKGVCADANDADVCTYAHVQGNHVLDVGEQLGHRVPSFAEAGLVDSWTGVYDVTPDWNPVLGALPGVDGLLVAYGFSGHGFKLSPGVGRVLAQEALRLPTDVPLAPYALERFASGQLLTGKYGLGAVS